MRQLSKVFALGACLLGSGFAAASVNGAKIPSVTTITDGRSNEWFVSSGIVYENGAKAGYTANVVALLYSGGVIYQENSSGGWWSWNGRGWSNSRDPRTVSASGATLPSAAQLIDGSLNIWTTSSGVVYENGAKAGYTANVVTLLFSGGVIYQENSSGGWWSWNGNAWASSPNPRRLAAVTSSATRLLDNSSNAWTVVSGVVYKNGVAAGYSGNVKLLVNSKGVIYQENTSDGWWSWNGSSWVASGNPQASAVNLGSSKTPTSNPITTKPTATATTTGTGYPSYSGQFGVQVKGNKMVSTQDGSDLQIIGTNVSGLEGGYGSELPLFSGASSASWALVKKWGHGVNTVRLPLSETTWLNYECEDPGAGVAGRYTYTGVSASGKKLYKPDPTEQYKATVEAAVANATAAGLYVILDLHWGAPNGVDGIGICPIGQPGFADADHALAFWKDVADTFKNNPAVMFELFNEPFGDNDFGQFVQSVNGGNNNKVGPEAYKMRDGGAFSPFVTQNNANGNAPEEYEFGYNVAGMQQMIDVIRGENAGNVILSAAPWWAGEVQLWTQSMPTDPHGQLAASWHAYGWTGTSGGHDGPGSVLAAGFPLVITEQWNVAGVSGGYAWLASQGIGFCWWGQNLWQGQSLATEFSTSAPWSDASYGATAPNY